MIPVLLLGLMLLVGGRELVTRRGTVVRVDLLLLTYPLGLLVLGMVGGAVLPMARKRWTAVCAGILAIAPLCFGITLGMDRGYESWTPMHTGIASFMSIVFGGAVAAGYHGDELNPRRSKRAG